MQKPKLKNLKTLFATASAAAIVLAITTDTLAVTNISREVNSSVRTQNHWRLEPDDRQGRVQNNDNIRLGGGIISILTRKII